MASAALGGARRADARANRAAVLEAATALIGRAGWELPYDEIAAAAGVGRATVYRHFPTRDALLRALLETALERWDTVVAGLAPGPGRLQALIDAWVQMQRERPHAVDLTARTASEGDLRRARRHFEATLREPLREAQRAGLVAAQLTSRDVRLVLTMLSAALHGSHSPGDQRRAIDLARGMLIVSPDAAPRIVA